MTTENISGMTTDFVSVEEIQLGRVEMANSQLDTLFNHLDDDTKDEERKTRPALFSAYARYLTDRFDFGRVLARYWFWAQSADRNSESQKSTFKSLCIAIGIEERTARNIRHDYEEAIKVPEFLREAGFRAGYDISEFRYRGLIAELLKADHFMPADIELRKSRGDKVFARALQLWLIRPKNQLEELNDFQKLLAFTYHLFNNKTALEMRDSMKRVQDEIAYDKNGDFKIQKPKKAKSKKTQEAA